MADENAAATGDQDGANSSSTEAPVTTAQPVTPVVESKYVGEPVSAELLVSAGEAVDDTTHELVILENEDRRECSFCRKRVLA